ncbi:MAG TPA: two-component regulator propeller domain-containing protein [bacterium]|nr:two-component regulator propeller domain-containing protein [bacterium]
MTQYMHTMWTTDQGLPQNNITSMLQTRDGYIWCGTLDGLVRFDGVRFEVFDKRNTPAIRNNAIITMFEDRSGGLWVGTIGGGLVHYKNGKFISYGLTEKFPSAYILHMAEDEQGRLWFATRDGLVTRGDTSWITYTAKEGLTHTSVRSLFFDRKGRLWIGSSVGLSLMENGVIRKIFAHELADKNVTSITSDSTDIIWITVLGKGVYRIKGDSIAHLQAPKSIPHNFINAIARDKNGNRWLATDGGLYREHHGRFERFMDESNFPLDKVMCLLEDRDGNLWFGTNGSGLNRLRDEKFITYTTLEGLKDNSANVVFEDSRARIWVGTEAGVSIIDGDTIRNLGESSGLTNTKVRSFAEDTDGRIWVGTREGVFVWNEVRFESWNTRLKIPPLVILSMLRARDGTMWIGTGGAGAVSYKPQNVQQYTSKQGLAGIVVIAMAEDSLGRMWFGTNSGLSRFDGKNFVTYNSKNGMSSDIFLSLYVDKTNTLWAGTFGNGLNRLQNDSIAIFTTADGLFNENMYSILEDGEGYLWMSCGKGVFRVAKEDFERYRQKIISVIPCKVFGRSDGMRSSECNGTTQPAAWMTRSGWLLYPTGKGLAAVNPRLLSRVSPSPLVVIERMLAEQKLIGLGEKIELTPGHRRIEFTFTGLSFTAPENNTFMYRLIGFDKEWIQAEKTRHAVYTNVPPGAYRFEAKASNSDGIWSSQPATVLFSIDPYFFETVWFYSLSGVFLLYLGFTYYRSRVRELHERQEELTRLVQERTRNLREEKEKTEHALRESEEAKREIEKSQQVIQSQSQKLIELDKVKTNFFTNISHEFRTPLTLIIGPLEDVLRSATLSADQRVSFELMLRQAKQLLGLINQLLEAARLESNRVQFHPSLQPLVPFVRELTSMFESAAQRKGIHLSLETYDEKIQLYYDLHAMERVLTNLISNAIKFTEQGFIKITIKHSEHTHRPSVVIFVEDSGRGIPQEHLGHIFQRFYQADGVEADQLGSGIGLSLVHDYVEMHRGLITVESTVGKGTRFMITLFTGEEHLSGTITPHAEIKTETEFIYARSIAALSSEHNIAPEISAPDPMERQTADKPKVLIADDNADIRLYLYNLLRDEYRMIMAHDGAAALDLLQREFPDMVLSDVMMPNMDGMELCRRIKSDERTRHIPVILLTARADESSKVESLNLGADDFVAKPFSANELKARMRNLLGIHAMKLQLIEQEKMASLGHLARGVAHEINNPLSFVTGNLSVLESRLAKLHPDENIKPIVTDIMSGTKRIAAIVQHLREFTRLDEAERKYVDLSDMVDNILTLLAGEMQSDIRIEKNIAQVPMIDCFPRDLNQAIAQILMNATYYVRERNRIENRSLGHITIHLNKADEKYVELIIENDGFPIAPEIREHIFEPFFTTKPIGKGTGLGLSAVYGIIRRHHGQIRCVSEPFQPVRFIIMLPFAIPS